MHISVVGGMARLEPHYRKEVEKLGYELRIYNKPESRMASKIANSEVVVLFTGKVSHEARNQVVAAAKGRNIPLIMCHSCGVCSFRDCLACFARGLES
jgi:Uncharacterized protein conserved in bacteria (DUF2325)